MPASIRHVLATVRYQGSHRERLVQICAPAPVTFVQPADAAGIEQALERADVAVLAGDLDQRFIAAPGLKWVHCDHAGIERSAHPAVFERGLRVTGSAGRSAPALAEHAIYFMLSLCYAAPMFFAAQQRRQWGFRGARQLRGLYGRTVGILGLGHTGSALAVRAKALGMTVVGYRRRATSPPPGVDVLKCADRGDQLEDFLPALDFLVIALSLNNATRHLIGARELAMLKPTARLINIARGAIVDEHALLTALQERRLAGAGLDVFEVEPLPQNSGLWGAPWTLITPHVTPQVPDRTSRSLELIGENFRRYRSGEPLLNELRPEDAYGLPA